MTPSAPTPPPKRAVRRSANPVRSLLVLIFRLLLLGVGGTVAGLLGITAAQLRPAPPSEEPPILEKMLRRVDDMRGTLKPVPVAESPASPVASPLPTPAVRRLNPTERQQVQTEIATLRTELTSLGNRTTALEVRVGAPRSAAPIETRLQTLAQQLQPPTASPPAAAPPVSPAAPDPKRLGVTLPSDALFTADQTSLRSEGQLLLNTVVSELQRYPGAAILVAAHTDAQANAATARERSFAQAQAIARSLEGVLGEQYHWVAVGYGQTEPIAPNTSPTDRQRNRRIEIDIFPRE